MPTIFLILIAAMLSKHSHAETYCKEITWTQGLIIEVEGTEYKHVSVTMPEDTVDVVWAPRETQHRVWQAAWVKNHLMIQPLNHDPLAAEATFTVIGTSGNSYEILARRVPKLKNQCVIVKVGGGMINRAAFDTLDTQKLAQTETLRQQLIALAKDKEQLTKNAATDGQRQAREAVDLYRKTINTGYEWDQAQGWHAGVGVVESVHDDGRFTFVRLANDDRGLMAIMADIDGKPETLEATYDATNRMYRVVGIFPMLKLKSGKSELTITRKRV